MPTLEHVKVDVLAPIARENAVMRDSSCDASWPSTSFEARSSAQCPRWRLLIVPHTAASGITQSVPLGSGFSIGCGYAARFMKQHGCPRVQPPRSGLKSAQRWHRHSAAHCSTPLRRPHRLRTRIYLQVVARHVDVEAQSSVCARAVSGAGCSVQR